jgi:hypothetical protein
MRGSLTHGAPLFPINWPSLSSRLQFFYCSNLNDPPKHWQTSARLHAVISHIHWHNINLTWQQKFLYSYAKHTEITQLFNVCHHVSNTDQCVITACKHVMRSSQDRILQILTFSYFYFKLLLKTAKPNNSHKFTVFSTSMKSAINTLPFYSCWTCPSHRDWDNGERQKTPTPVP